MRHTNYRFFLLPLFFVLACVGVWAQANSEITGIVTDQTGAVVAGAKIVVTEPSTGFTSTTFSGPTGLYDVPGLNPANYNMKVTAKGFQTFVQTGVVVNVSQTARADIKLTVGAETTTVEVQADALAVQADSNVVSSLISSEQITELATENRNFAALAALGLGVSSALPDSNTPTSVAANFTISVNGLRQSHNIWLIDGGEADDRGGAGGMDIMPSQDAIAEFTMLTSNYPPDYGISSGATMSLSLKSGTQKFHGSLYEFNRNTDYDANQYLNKIASDKTKWVPRTNTHYNIFGANLGGPLYIPNFYNTNKQKTFFFINEEGRRILSGAGTNNVNTIDAADRPVAGQDLKWVGPKFSPTSLKVPTAIGDPKLLATLQAHGLKPGDPMPIIYKDVIDPNAITYLQTSILPMDNTGNDTHIANNSNPINVWDTVGRIDHRFNDKWQILGHYMEDRVEQGYASPFLNWLWASYNTVTSSLLNPSDSAAVKITGTITPNLLLEASINYDGNVIKIVNSNNGKIPASGWTVNRYFNNGSLNMPGMSWNGPYWSAEQMGSAPWKNAARDYEPKVDISYTSGKHQMKYGFSYNRYTKNQQLFGDPGGNFGFGGATGDAMADMIMGISSGFDQAQALPIRHYVNQTPSAYINDNWHVTPRVTLQLGFRFDALPHAWERNNDMANFEPNTYLSSLVPTWLTDPDTGKQTGAMDPKGPGFRHVNGTDFYLNGMVLAGKFGTPRGLVTNDYDTYQPRVGFSADLFGNGKTVLRGGFGTFFERMQGNDSYNVAPNAPFAWDPGSSNVYLRDPHVSWGTGATAAVPTFASGLTTLAKTYKAPAVAQFSLGVQHEIVPSVIWVVQYVGNLAWHQNITRNINNFPLNTDLTVRCDSGDGNDNYSGDVCPDGTKPTSLPSNANFHQGNFYRTYQGYNGIVQEENTTNGNYNGFQTGVRIQNRWGLSGEVDYTFSHEIDLTSYDLSGVSNPWNLKYDKGSGALDRRQMLNINYIYKLPFFTKDKGLVHTLAGGWELAGTAIFENGVPQVVNDSLGWDPVGLGGGYTVRPNVSGKMHYPKKFGQWFDTSKFSISTPAWLGGPNQGFGSGGKDAVVGPNRVNFTTSLYKQFQIREGMHVELRGESFNTFNHSEPNNLNTTFDNGTYSTILGSGDKFGQVSSFWDARNLEIGAKFVF